MKQPLQRSSRAAPGSAIAPPLVNDVLRTSGEPLDRATREFMEPRFQHDFSNVRVHRDDDARRSAAAVHARAYTVGSHIVFGESPSRELLAHELTHVVQQSNADPWLARKCDAFTPADCKTYGGWIKTLPIDPKAGEGVLTNGIPDDLAALIHGEKGSEPDCADVAMILRHYYLQAQGRSASIPVTKETTYTLGKGVESKALKSCLQNTGTTNLQETRPNFTLINFLKERGNPIRNLRKLIDSGLKPGDVFLWKATSSGHGYDGHAQTVHTIVDAKRDPKSSSKVLDEGHLILVQGNMEGQAGAGQLQQKRYSFSYITGKDDGDGEIKQSTAFFSWKRWLPSENFFGAGPWKGGPK